MSGPEDGRRIPPLGAGRHAAGRALLGWLDDPRAPRLCRISGGAGAGKSHLLAWLVRGSTADATPDDRRIHGILPAAGLTARAAIWQLGQQLHTVAHQPDDLLAALRRDGRRTVICVPELDKAVDADHMVTELLDPLLELPHVRLVVEAATDGPAAAGFTRVPAPAVLELDDPQWTDRERFTAWCAGLGADADAYPSPGRALRLPEPSAPVDPSTLLDSVPPGPDGSPDLRTAGEALLTDLWSAASRTGELGRLTADPLLYALARPDAVTAAVEVRSDAPATAWRAAGPALIDEPDPAVRAAVLRTRLLGTDDRAAAALAGTTAPWAGRWANWENSADARAWPGPVTEMAVGSGAYGSQILVADRGGAVRSYDVATGRRAGTVVVPGPKPLRGLAVTAGGTVLLLDAWGGTELIPPSDSWPGLEPHALAEAVDSIRSVATAELTAVATIGRLPAAAPAFGDAGGSVHWAQPDAIRSARLHRGPVTALAGVALGGGGLSDPDLPFLVSGGLDGTVQLWGPTSEPMADPSDRRGCPVTAVAAGTTAAGPLTAAAWADGLVRVRDLGRTGGVLDLRLGSEVWSLALIGTLLVVGMPDGLAALDLRRR